jgi:hypothetical protein
VEIKTPNTGETAVAAKLQRSDLFLATSSIKKQSSGGAAQSTNKYFPTKHQ